MHACNSPLQTLLFSKAVSLALHKSMIYLRQCLNCTEIYIYIERKFCHFNHVWVYSTVALAPLTLVCMHLCSLKYRHTKSSVPHSLTSDPLNNNPPSPARHSQGTSWFWNTEHSASVTLTALSTS